MLAMLQDVYLISLQYADDESNIVSFIRHLGSSRLSSFQSQHNKVAHILASHGLLQGVFVAHKEYCPLSISNSVKLDLMKSLI